MDSGSALNISFFHDSPAVSGMNVLYLIPEHPYASVFLHGRDGEFFGDKPTAVAMTNAVVLNHLPNSGD